MSLDILMVNYEWPGVTKNCGGGGRIGRELKRGLTDRGHAVSHVTDWSDGHYLTFPLRYRSYIGRVVAQRQPDVIHGQFSLPSSLFLPEIGSKHGVPVAVSVMGADVYDPTRFQAVRPTTDVLNKHLLKSADAVIAPSTDMQRRVKSTYGIDADTIPYGIDADNWTWRARDLHDPVRVLTVARLVDRKNLRRAYEALAQLSRPVEWRLVGTGDNACELESTFGDEDWVTFRGYVDNLGAEFSWGDLFYLPSKHEAFGIVFLEALASGLPVVTSNHGGQTDIVDPLVGASDAAPHDIDGLKDSLKYVIRKYDILQSNTRGYVANEFSREKMVAAYEQAFYEVTA